MVNFGLIGCGKIGNRHIGFLNKIEGVKVVGVADIVEERAKAAAGLCGAKPYVCYKEMLKDPDLLVVSICSPSGLHAPMSIDALRAGKHVLCEKPMALSTRDADKMIGAAKESGKKLFIVKQNRHNRPIKILKSALEGGFFGEVYHINSNVIWNRHAGYYAESNWRGKKDMDGGALSTLASHFIDIMQWFGGPVESVFMKKDNFVHNIETEDTGSIIMRFKNRAMGTMFYTSCAYNSNIEGSITVLGTKGSAKISGEYLNKIEHWNVEGFPLPEDADETGPQNDYGSYRGSSSKHDVVFRELIKKIIGDEEAGIVNMEEGKKTVEIIEAAHLSADLNKEIYLPRKDNGEKQL